MFAPLRMYWVCFLMDGEKWRDRYVGMPPACGVTAFDSNDAVSLAWKWLGSSEHFPEVESVTELRSVFEIPDDNRHSQGVTVWRGVWAPAVNLYYGPDLDYASDGSNSPKA